MNVTQQLKLIGLLRDVPLDEVHRAPIPARQMETDVNEPYCGNPVHRDEEIANSTPEKVNRALGLGSRELAGRFIELHQQTPPDGAEEADSGSWPPNCPHIMQFGYTDARTNGYTYYVSRSKFSRNWKRPMRDDEWQDLVDLVVYDEEHGGPWGPLKSIEDCKRTFVYKDPEHAAAAGAQVGDLLDVLDMCVLITEEINRRVGCPGVRVFTGENGQHNVHVRGENMPGSLAGYAYFNNGTCLDHVNLYLDNLLSDGFIRLLNLTYHEVGHTLSLRHQFSGQSGPNGHHEGMSYSSVFHTAQGWSTGDFPYELRRAPSITVLQRFFDWQTYIPPPLYGEEPPPPPLDDKEVEGTLEGQYEEDLDIFSIQGVITITGTFEGDQYIVAPIADGKYKLVPKRRV